MNTAHRLLGAWLLSAGVALATPAQAQQISSFGFVYDDGSLRVAGNHIRLYGIYVPPTGQSCYTFIRPMPCGSRAKLALEFRITGHFVNCIGRAVNPDGSLSASCSVEGEDLSEWMLQRGWAVALPDAPFHYTALERIARSHGIGIWGIPIDVIR